MQSCNIAIMLHCPYNQEKTKGPPKMYEINKRIREEMARQGLTMTDLARMSGLNRSSISRYVSDTIEPKQNAIGAIAQALKVSPAWLLGFDVEHDEPLKITLDISDLSEINQAKIIAYYEGLKDSQKGDKHGDA